MYLEENNMNCCIFNMDLPLITLANFVLFLINKFIWLWAASLPGIISLTLRQSVWLQVLVLLASLSPAFSYKLAVSLQGSWIAWISSLKSCVYILRSTNLNHFQHIQILTGFDKSRVKHCSALRFSVEQWHMSSFAPPHQWIGLLYMWQTEDSSTHLVSFYQGSFPLQTVGRQWWLDVPSVCNISANQSDLLLPVEPASSRLPIGATGNISSVASPDAPGCWTQLLPKSQEWSGQHVHRLKGRSLFF